MFNKMKHTHTQNALKKWNTRAKKNTKQTYAQKETTIHTHKHTKKTPTHANAYTKNAITYIQTSKTKLHTHAHKTQRNTDANKNIRFTYTHTYAKRNTHTKWSTLNGRVYFFKSSSCLSCLPCWMCKTSSSSWCSGCFRQSRLSSS